jgi:hypothetical protein
MVIDQARPVWSVGLVRDRGQSDQAEYNRQNNDQGELSSVIEYSKRCRGEYRLPGAHVLHCMSYVSHLITDWQFSVIAIGKETTLLAAIFDQ